DCLLFEEGDCLYIGRGLDRSWLAAGPVGIENGLTHFGRVSFEMCFDRKKKCLVGWV
ncbi:unnamed protein product, partial [marine sediment metagenome]